MRWLGELLKAIGEAMAPDPQPPAHNSFKRITETYTDVRSELEASLECMIKDESRFKPDYWTTFTDREGWVKAVPWLTFPAEYYTGEELDCDDYARKAAAEASFLFKLNGCFQAWGYRPDPSDPNKQVRHAWALGYIGNKKYVMWEPNAGFDETGRLLEERDGYVPESWK